MVLYESCTSSYMTCHRATQCLIFQFLQAQS
ncbi:hypothetical protein T01_332 [Trichinella spiralis]|uniref:Uncharacterized protein n=1 Tax=Trichinella spiralis TaxID=6334 RepID=A0A0V0YRU7_TRISP|nr:hypothetical protein T01_332 [Trichinella spiralis]